MSDPIDALEAIAGELLANLADDRRRKLAREIAAELRASQQRRIAAQQNPDGTPYAPRKPQLRQQQGRIRRQMFSKLRTARFLKASGTPEAAIVAFTAQVSRIARVHQEGGRDIVNRRTGQQADYPQRQLLGFTDADRALIAEKILEHIGRE